MTTRKKSSPEKKSFSNEGETSLQATALSAIESALIPHLSEKESTSSLEDASHLLGKIPISLTMEETEAPEIQSVHTSREFNPDSSAQAPKEALPDTPRKIHILSSQDTSFASQDSSLASSSPSLRDLYVPLKTKYSYWAAIIAAFVWLTVLGLLFLNQNMPFQEGLLLNLVSFAHMSMVSVERISWLVLPPLLFFLCAVLYVRSQSIKHTIEMMNFMVARLSQPESLAMDSVTTLSQAVRREVAAIGDGVERALARVGEFETMIRAEIGMLERAYADGEQRIHMLADKLALQKEEVVLTTEDLRTSMVELHKSLTHDLEDARDSLVVSLSQHIDLARTALQTTSKDITSTMSTQVEETSNQLKNMSEMLFVSLGVRCADINQQLAETAQRVETDLSSHTDKLSDQFSEKCGEVYTYMTQKAFDLTEKWNEIGQKIFVSIEDGIETARINLEAAAEKSVTILDEKSSYLCTSLLSHTRESQDALVTTGKDVVTAMASQTARIHESLMQQANSISDVLKNRGTEVNSLIDNRLMALKALLEDRATNLIQDFNAHLTTLRELLEVQGGSLNTSFDTHTERLEKAISQDGAHLLSRVEDVTSGFSSRVNESVTKATELFSNGGEKIMHILESKVHIISEMLSNHFATFESGAEAQVTSFVRSTESLFHRLYEDLSRHFSRNSQSLQEDITGKTVALSELFSANERKLHQTLTEKTEQLEHASSEANAHLQEVVETAASVLERSLRYRGAEIAEAVAERTKHFEETVSSQLDSFNANFQERTHSLKISFDTHGTEFLESFQKESDGLAKEIIHIGETIVHTLESRAISVSDILRESSQSLTSLMTRSAEALQETIDATATRSVSHLVAANHHVQEDLSRISQAISDASNTLKAIVTETRTDLTDVERALSEQTGSLTLILSSLTQATDVSSEKLYTKIDELKTVTQSALGETDALVNKLDSQGRAIASFSIEHAENLVESVHHLESVGTELTRSLSARKDSLEAAITSVLERAEAIASMTELLDSDLNRHCTTIEANLNHVSEVLTQGAQKAMDSLKEHYDLLCSLAMEGSTQSNQDMAHLREQITIDINDICAQSLEKFHSFASKIQDIATAIRNDLEGTHLQLKNSLLKLPEASEKTSTAMRRVIVDQINALDALNALVKRASTDGSGPVLSEADRHVLVNVSKSKEPQLTRHSSSPLSPSITPLNASSEKVPPSLIQRKETSQSSTVAPPAGVDTGWLSPLLERASGKGSPSIAPKASFSPPPPSAPQAEKHDAVSDRRALRSHLALLNTLARDIPKIVDSQRIDEAWTRYYRGEPQTFTEALYTPHGQHVFRDVSRRYQESHDFRQTVSHYIEEFENLLESSGIDGSSPTKRAYLTSDTGKMYTFLAHLSGRL